MEILTFYIVTVLFTLTPFIPCELDKDGWGLRVHRLARPGPYLVGESLQRDAFDIMLHNFSDKTREYWPLPIARDLRDLDLAIMDPDNLPMRGFGRRVSLPDPLAQRATLRRGEFTTIEFHYGEFGYQTLRKTGRYRLVASLRIGQITVTSPPVEFEVVEVPADAVLAIHAVPLEGDELKLPANEPERPGVQQVRLGTRVFLVYRRFVGPRWGGGVDHTARLAELPGKVEMTVEGAYEARNPLKIRYKDANSKTGTITLVINSISGSPWTEEEERLRIERAKAPTPTAPPPPRAIKP
jgi:hypothetical protein